MKRWVVYTIAVTIVAVAGVSFAVGVVVTGALDDDGSANVQATEAPTERPTSRPTPEPTEYAPRLKGLEAATLVDSVLTDANPGSESWPDWVCWPGDFNVDERAWPITCVGGIGSEVFTLYHLVDDASGEITPLN